MDTAAFREEVWAKGSELYRQMPWREEPSFYNVLVSELMLQQTQVERVRVKFAEFMYRFPSIEDLAAASLSDVLAVWQGLGYNRRAKFLHDAAKAVVRDGVPSSLDSLTALPGVGKNTAGAIMNYVYDVATPFIETNIRTVYFHHFFPYGSEITDKQLEKVVAETLDRESPRAWFYALMDYGTYLKRQGSGKLDVSRHYKKQSPLKGSVREVRGELVRILTKAPASRAELIRRFDDDIRLTPALDGLIRDGLVTERRGIVQLTN